MRRSPSPAARWMMENVARIDELERKYADNPRRYFAPLANEYRRAGDSRRAIDLCRTQLPEIPGHISGHIVLAQALYDSGDFADSRSTFEAALILDPENILALRYLGDIARQEGNLAEAERWYGRALEADPHNEAAVLGLELARGGAAAPAAAEPEAEAVAYAAAPVEQAVEQIAEAPVEDAGGPSVEGAGEPPAEELPATAAETMSEAAAEVEIPEEESAAIAERVLELAAPFVTETMADLYLEQGYVTEALDLLRQLAEQRTGDAALLDKIAAIESQSVADRRAGAAEGARQETVFTDSGSHQSAPVFDPGVVPPASDVRSEPTALSDLLPAGYGTEPLHAEAPSVEPTEVAAAPSPKTVEEPAAAERTMRDFFADMDRMRPQVVSGAPALDSGTSTGPLPFWNSSAPVPPEDESAAREMAGVFAPAPPMHGPPPPASPEEPTPVVPMVSGPHPAFDPATADMKEFDAWLRGLKTS